MGVYFRSQLEQLAESFPIIREVRGAGMMLALELDRPGMDVVTDCMQQGFLINCIQQNVLRFLPPLTVTQKEIERLIKALSKSLTKLKK
jgi:acetylornithine/succinyldiaminopimelate/putrescine aminotransferase